MWCKEIINLFAREHGLARVLPARQALPTLTGGTLRADPWRSGKVSETMWRGAQDIENEGFRTLLRLKTDLDLALLSS